jgi:spore coat protein SA
MRVAFVSQPWSRVVPPVEQADSIAIWTYEVARRLTHQADVTIYSKALPGRPRVERQEDVKYRRVPLLREQLWRRVLRRVLTPMGVRSPEFHSPLYHRAYITQIALALRLREYDIVHVHQFPQFASAIKAIAPASRIVLHMTAEWLTQLEEATVRSRLESVEGIFACSGFLSDKIRARFPEFRDRCFVVPNGVDVAQLAPTEPAPQAGRTNGPPKVLFVGRVSPEKAVHVVIQAFERVAAQVPDAHLEILGPDAVAPKEFIVGLSDDPRVRALAPWYDGDYYTRLQQMVPAPLRARIRFLGEVGRSSLRGHYAGAHVLVNPSLSETFGMTLIEALVSGVPVVATPVGGMTEIVDHERTGLFAEAGDPASLAEAIVRLLKDPLLRDSIAAAGRRMVLERFTWDRVAQRALDSYRQIA